ncbi:hypothetical protein [Candidatus Sodalis sp. SoCistrobi]|nr:hypothetical protein [Candidatus Sodalis sp. SoCistrobi]
MTGNIIPSSVVANNYSTGVKKNGITAGSDKETLYYPPEDYR